MKDLQKTAAITPISDHKRFVMKTEPPVRLLPEVRPHDELALDRDETTDMDSVANIQQIRQCAWTLSHRHGVLTATEMLRLLIEEMLTGAKP